MFENLEFTDMFSDDHFEPIPLISINDKENDNKEKLPDSLPIIPLRNNVLFPSVVIPISVFFFGYFYCFAFIISIFRKVVL